MSYGSHLSHLSKLDATSKLAVKKGMFYDQVTGDSYPNLARLKPDKCMWTKEIRSMFIGCIEDNGHTHEDFHVLLFPEEIFQQDETIFIPAVSWKCNKPEKVPIPTYMINLLPGQFKRIAKVAAEHGIFLRKLDFMKPKIAIGAMERLEYEELGNAGGVFEN